MRISKIIDENGFQFSIECYIVKKKDFYYVQIADKQLGICPLCGEKDQLTAHHIIPKRLKSKNKMLNELRIKICYKCHLEIDGVNKYILICKRLFKMLDDITNGKILQTKEFSEIQKELAINLNAYGGSDTWNKPELKLSTGYTKRLNDKPILRDTYKKCFMRAAKLNQKLA